MLAKKENGEAQTRTDEKEETSHRKVRWGQKRGKLMGGANIGWSLLTFWLRNLAMKERTDYLSARREEWSCQEKIFLSYAL